MLCMLCCNAVRTLARQTSPIVPKWISSSEYFARNSPLLTMGKFAEGNVVWAADNGNVYLSKIIKATHTGKLSKYFIHFQGWAAKYDVWADEHNLVAEQDTAGKKKLGDSLLGITKSTGGKKKDKGVSSEIAGTNTTGEGTEDKRASSSSSSAAAAGSSHKRKNIVTDEEQHAAKKRRKELADQDLIDEYCGLDGEYFGKIQIPLNIKKHLVDEWSVVCTGPSKRLLQLPRAATVKDIIEEFLDEKEKKNTGDAFGSYKELFEGFQIYFDRALPYILLYRQEREQFEILSSLVGDSFQPSEYYGGEHLIRLFVRLQRLLSGVFIDQADMSQIIAKLTEFLKWLERNKERFFIIGDYISADESIEALKVFNVKEYEKSKVKEAAPAPVSAKKSKELKAVQEIVCSPVTGRPMRAHAGKNKHLEE